MRMVGKWMALGVSVVISFLPLVAAAQEKISDEVAVVVTDGRMYGLTGGSGFVRARLSAGEEVVFSEAKGINAVAQTPNRLLGFSGQVQRWQEERLDVSEKIQTTHVTSRLIFVRTDKRLFGFQGPIGRWKVQDLGI